MQDDVNPYMPTGFRVSLRARLLFAFFFTVLVPVLVFALIAVRVIFSGIATLEDAALRDSLKQTLIVLDSEEQTLAKNVQDYARWDDMFDPSISHDEDWQRRNITEWIPVQFDVDVIWLAEQNGDVFYRYNVPAEFAQNVSTVKLFQAARKGEQPYGLMMTSKGLMMAATSYISPSREPAGYDVPTQSPAVLFYGRFIDSSVAAKVSSLTDRPVDVFDTQRLVATSEPSREWSLGASIEDAVVGLSATSNAEQTLVIGNATAIFVPMIDVNANHVGMIGVYRNSPIGNFVRDQLFDTLVAAVILAFSVGIGLSLFFGSRLARAVKNLKHQVQSYTRGDFHHPITVNRRDELGELQGSFAYLIKTLERAKVRMEEQDITILDVLARAAATTKPTTESTTKKHRRKRV